VVEQNDESKENVVDPFDDKSWKDWLPKGALKLQFVGGQHTDTVGKKFESNALIRKWIGCCHIDILLMVLYSREIRLLESCQVRNSGRSTGGHVV
jgi:hypothetical protein